MSEDMERRVAQYIQIRDRIKLLDDEHKGKMETLRDLQERVSGELQEFLSANNLVNLKTKAGTCYITSRRTATLSDPDAFMNYVIANAAFDLMDRRANGTAVADFVKKHKALPPGCNLNTIATVGVRRGNGAADDDDK